MRRIILPRQYFEERDGKNGNASLRACQKACWRAPNVANGTILRRSSTPVSHVAAFGYGIMPFSGHRIREVAGALTIDRQLMVVCSIG